MSRATSRKGGTQEPLFGHWWFPDDPTRRVAGRLTLGSDGPIELELFDLLVDGDVDARHAVVLGTASDGQAITVEDLQWIAGYNRDWVRFGQALRRETFMVGAAYLGAHLTGPEERSFSEARITLSDLLLWAGPSGIDERHGPDPVEVTVSLTLPARREVNLAFGLLTMAHGWATRGDLRHSREIAKTVGFVVRIHDAWELTRWLTNVVGPLRHLLTFATDRANEVERLAFVRRHSSSDTQEVEVVYARSQAPAGREPRAFEFLFDVPRLGDDFTAVVQRWFSIAEEMSPVVELLLAQRYRPIVFAESRFLNAVTAAEVFHRIRMARPVMPVREHRARIESIVDAVPNELGPWIREKLAHSNEPTLRARLEELAATAPELVKDVLGTPAGYAAPVVGARNALTHDPSRRDGLGLTGRELLRLTEQTSLLVTAHLLRDLGFPDAGIEEAVRRTRRYRLLDEVLQPESR